MHRDRRAPARSVVPGAACCSAAKPQARRTLSPFGPIDAVPVQSRWRVFTLSFTAREIGSALRTANDQVRWFGYISSLVTTGL